MMNESVKNIMLRVLKKRMKAGEKVDEILADYPKLTEDEKNMLKKAIA